jgi:hypothetical protein
MIGEGTLRLDSDRLASYAPCSHPGVWYLFWSPGKAMERSRGHLRVSPFLGRPHETENKVRLGLRGSLDPKKPLQNSITAGFTESQHRDPTACCGDLTVFHGKPLYARPRGELNSLSYSIFRFVCIALQAGFTTSPRCVRALCHHRIWYESLLCCHWRAIRLRLVSDS